MPLFDIKITKIWGGMKRNIFLMLCFTTRMTPAPSKRAPDTFKFPGWKCPLRGWKYFAAVITHCGLHFTQYFLDRLVFIYSFFASLEALEGVSQSEGAGISTITLSFSIRLRQFCLHRCYSPIHCFWLLFEDCHNRGRAHQRGIYTACEWGNGLTGELVFRFSLECF